MIEAESEQQRAFQLRLARIAHRMGGSVAPGPGVLRQRPWAPLLLWPLALAAGLVGHAMAMILRFRLANWPEAPGPDLLAQLICGVLIATLIGAPLGRAFALRPVLHLAGVALGLLVFADLVHLWPGISAKLLSQPMVNQILAQTKAHSLLWLGIISNH